MYVIEITDLAVKIVNLVRTTWRTWVGGSR